jgi:hypothetical protein
VIIICFKIQNPLLIVDQAVGGTRHLRQAGAAAGDTMSLSNGAKKGADKAKNPPAPTTPVQVSGTSAVGTAHA